MQAQVRSHIGMFLKYASPWKDTADDTDDDDDADYDDYEEDARVP